MEGIKREQLQLPFSQVHHSCMVVKDLEKAKKYYPGFGKWPGPFGLKLYSTALGVTIPDDRVLPMLDALQEELRWRKRVLSEEEFRKLAEKICGNAGARKEGRRLVWNDEFGRCRSFMQD